MKYKIQSKDKPKEDIIKSVMFRLPVDILIEFNDALKNSNLSAQLLVENMVRHCLAEIINESET